MQTYSYSICLAGDIKNQGIRLDAVLSGKRPDTGYGYLT
ncbi:hypothetical protein SOHN41_04003 [Shewanella sp. HN-41]|nr:hypothetical protein SOHN41_04003 [Shewanella sp. HN-41]